MAPGARTPEELETLLEDAFLARHPATLGLLFEDAGVLTVGGRPAIARGRLQIEQACTEIWERGDLYLAAPTRILQAGASALITSHFAISVGRRSENGLWRYAITLLNPQPQTERNSR